jgi:hypothetical protein
MSLDTKTSTGINTTGIVVGFTRIPRVPNIVANGAFHKKV